MHVLVIFLMMTSLFLFSPIGHADAFVDLGISIGDEGLRGFYLAVGDYYRVPQREVIIIRERGIPTYEMPVVFFIATRAHVAPATIIDLRLHGRTWLNIMLHFGLGPEILYVPVKGVYGPPYGKAYGYYKNKPKNKWKSIVLHDEDVINLVNLKFISDYHKVPPEKVIKMRSQGKNFTAIDYEIRKYKKDNSGKGKEKQGRSEKAKGHGKGKKLEI